MTLRNLPCPSCVHSLDSASITLELAADVCEGPTLATIDRAAVIAKSTVHWQLPSMAATPLVCALIFWIAVFTIAPASAKGHRVALVVGNSGYKHTTILKNPTNDAADMAAIFEDLGFQVHLGVDLDHRAFLRLARQFADALPEAEAAVLFLLRPRPPSARQQLFGSDRR